MITTMVRPSNYRLSNVTVGLVTHHISRHHVVNAIRVSWKIMPAVTEV